MKSLILSIALILCGMSASWAQSAAGKAVLVVGQVSVMTADGGSRPLFKGDSVFAGETINTARHSYANIQYADEGRTLVGPDSSLKIAEFEFQPARVAGGPRARSGAETSEPDGRSVFSLLKGSFRAVTGLIGKHRRDNVSITTRVATIGIRGTDMLVVDCDDRCRQMGGGAPDGTDPNGGTIVGVYEGGVFVAAQNGEQRDVDVNGFLLLTRDGQFVPLSAPPDFLMLMPMDDPAACE